MNARPAEIKGLRGSQRLYLASVFVTHAGNSCSFLVCGKVSLESFGLASIFGSMLLLEQVKSLILSAAGGTTVDRFGSKRVAVACDAILALSSALFAGLASSGKQSAAVLGAFFVINLAKPFYNAAIFALVRQLSADDSQVYLLNSRGAAAQQLGFFAGLALTGLLIARASTGALLAIDAATFLFSAILLAGCKLVGSHRHAILPQAHSGLFSRVRDQFKSFVDLLGSQRELSLLVLLIAFQVSLILAYNTAIFKLVDERFFGHPEYLSWFESIYAISVILTAFVVGKWPSLRVSVDNVWSLFLVQALIFGAMGWAHHAGLFTILIYIFGTLSSLIFPACFSALQKRTPAEHLGKVGGFRGAIQGLVGLPMLMINGKLLDGWGLQFAYAFMGVVCLGIAARVSMRRII